MFLRIKFHQILAALSVCFLVHILSIWKVHENKRLLSEDSFIEPVKECPEGEDEYFSSYPVVRNNWKPKSAFSHWKQHGKAEGKHYFCKCSKDGTDSETEEQKESGFVVVAIFKNEAMNFAEWISHYLWQGASHFYLIDNGSTDDWNSTISREDLARITVMREEKRHIQGSAIDSLLPMLRYHHARDWALIVDLGMSPVIKLVYS